MNPVHCMFDLETLGTGDHAPIVQIGAVLFSPWGDPEDFGGVKRGAVDPVGGGVISAPGSEFYKNVAFDRESLLNADPETIRWWLTKPTDRARLRVFGSETRSDLRQALIAFDGWLGSWGVTPAYLWSAMDFDLRLLRQAQSATELKRQCVWSNHKVGRDFRTLKWIGKSLGIESAPFVGVEHDALDDAMHDAYYAIKVLRHLGMKPLSGVD